MCHVQVIRRRRRRHRVPLPRHCAIVGDNIGSVREQLHVGIVTMVDTWSTLASGLDHVMSQI